MSFFKADDNKYFFTCFYDTAGGSRFSGQFYELSARQFHVFTIIYKLTAALSVAMLLLQPPVMFFALHTTAAWTKSVLYAAVIINACCIVPAAIFIFGKKKASLKKRFLALHKKSSISVYVATLLMPVNYLISLIWLMLTGSNVGGMLISFSILTLAIATASCFRLAQLFTMK